MAIAHAEDPETTRKELAQAWRWIFDNLRIANRQTHERRPPPESSDGRLLPSRWHKIRTTSWNCCPHGSEPLRGVVARYEDRAGSHGR